MSDEKPPAWADAMLASMHGIASEVTALKEQVKIQNGRVFALEQAKSSNSMRARAMSETDIETAAALSEEVIARKALAEKVDALTTKTDAQTAMLEKLTVAGAKVMANPTVRTIVILAGAAIIAWLKGHIQ